MEAPQEARRRVIAISGANYRRLQSFAIPLEDRVNDAFSKILDLAEAKREELLRESEGYDGGGSPL